jgi:AsmA family protein
VRIIDGRARVSLARLHADFEIAVSSGDETGQKQRTIRAEARGTYADQLVIATFLATGFPSLRDPTGDWPVELHLTNGPTRASLKGTLQASPKPRAASLDLQLAGPDLALLRPLTGVPLPPTPPYDLSGKLDYTEGRFHFTGVAGRVGRSDVGGTLTVTRGSDRPELTAELRSRSVNLRDIAGLLGGEPGPPGTPGQTPQQQKRAAQVHEQAKASPRLLPDKPLNLPKLRGVDAHLVYHVEQIQGRSMPLDDLTLRMDVVDGTVALRPLSFGVGAGRIVSNVLLTPAADEAVQTQVEVRFERLTLP